VPYFDGGGPTRAACHAFPEQCSCTRSCACVETWADLCGAVTCTMTNGVPVMTCQEPPSGK
jgi:hypothetical protein